MIYDRRACDHWNPLLSAMDVSDIWNNIVQNMAVSKNSIYRLMILTLIVHDTFINIGDEHKN